MKTIADTLGVVRSNLVAQATAGAPDRRRGRRSQPEAPLLAEINEVIAGQPTYGYRRVHALIRRRCCEQGGAAVNVKRVHRIMKAHGLERHTGNGEERIMTAASPARRLLASAAAISRASRAVQQAPHRALGHNPRGRSPITGIGGPRDC